MKTIKKLMLTLILYSLTAFTFSYGNISDTVTDSTQLIQDTNKIDTICFTKYEARNIFSLALKYEESKRRIKELEDQEQICIQDLRTEEEKRRATEVKYSLLARDYEDLYTRNNKLKKGVIIGGVVVGVGGIAGGIYLLTR